MTTVRRAALLVGAPLAFAVILAFHPMIGDYEGLKDVTTRFQIVHVAMVLAIPLLAVAIHQLLGGLGGRAATIGRVALIPFAVFYVLAFRRAGAPLTLQLLLGAAALIGAHAPPLAPIGWLCFAAAGWMVLRARRAPAAEPAVPVAAVAA